MKSLNIFRPAIKAMAMMMVVGSVLFVASCKDDEDPTFPAPTITVGTASASGLAGAKVTTTVTVDSPGGGKTLSILVSGPTTVTMPDVPLDGTESQAVPVEFTIPAAATVGQTYTLTFSSVDNAGQNSAPKTFTVTASNVADKVIVDVSTDITTNTNWTKDKIYRLTKLINVGTDAKPTAGQVAPVITATAILTIEPGTVIYGAKGTPGGGLIIHRGSKIMAEGTKAEPIIFTSGEPAGARAVGNWAGLVICGKAVNNVKISASTGLDGVEELEGSYGGFHGGGATAADDDNSGILKYVRVEFAGYPINPNQEINGITFGSVGSGTTIDYVQVSYSNDDAYEWFGGKVNAKHLIAYKTVDDDFDTDNGFRGQVQYGLVVREPQYADQSGSNAFESDNNSGGTPLEPFTDPTFSNITVIGGKQTQNSTIDINFQNVAQIRRNSKQDIINSFFTAFPNGIFIDNALGTPGSSGHAANGDLALKNNILAGVQGWGGNGFGSAASVEEQVALGIGPDAPGVNHPNNPRGGLAYSGSGAFNNNVFTPNVPATINGNTGLVWFTTSNTVKRTWNDASLGLSATIFDPLASTPVFTPGAGSALLSGASFTGYTGFDAAGAYRGAFGPLAADDWTTGWANWNPVAKDYSK